MEDERHGWKSGDASNMAIGGAAADSYRSRTTRRSKALKGTARGVHTPLAGRGVLPRPSPSSERGTVRPPPPRRASLFLSVTKKM
jgi:hypothetical protein